MSIFNLSEKVTYALGWVVLNSIWQAVVIAIVSGILLIAFRKKSSVFKYGLANAALFMVLVAAVATFVVYAQQYDAAAEIAFTPDESGSTTDVGGFNSSPSDQIQAKRVEPVFTWDGFNNYFNRNIYLIVALYLFGVAFFLIRLLGNVSYIYFLKTKMNFPPDEYWTELLENLRHRSGIQKTVDLVESAMVRSPMVVGYLKPMILFPIGAINRLNPSEVEAILAHELAHVMRNDYLFNIVQNLVEALFYYHPAVWWLSAQIRAERENCCDDKAIELCGNSMTYAKSLVSVQEMAYYTPQLAMGFSGNKKNQLLNRVQRILNQPQNQSNILEKMIATCVIFCFMVVLSLGGNRLDNQVEEPITTEPITETVGMVEHPEMKFSVQNFLKYSTSDGELDSLPVKGDINDGSYNIKDSMHDLTIVVKDKAVVQFIMNGLDVPASKIANFEKLIYKAFDKQQRYDNLAIADEEPGSIGNVVGEGSSIDEPVASLGMAEGDNSISSFSLSSNGKGFSFFTNGDQPSTVFNNRNAGDGTTLTMSTKGGYVYQFVKDKNKEVVHVSKNRANLGTVEMKNGQYLIKGKEATTEQLRAMGLVKSGNGLNPTQGKFEVGTVNIHGDQDDEEQNDENDDLQILQDQVVELQERLQCMRNKGIAAKKIDKLEKEASNLEKKLDAEGERGTQVNVEKYQSEIDKLGSQIDELCANSNGSDGAGSGQSWSRNGENYYYNSTGGSDSNLKSVIGAELRKDGLMAEAATFVSITDKNMMVNDKIVSNKVLDKYKKICTKATGVPFEKSQYFTFSYNDYKVGRNGGNAYTLQQVPPVPPVPPVPGVNDETNGKIYRSLVKALLDENYFQLNKHVSFEMTEKSLKVNGKRLEETTYLLVKSKMDKSIVKQKNWKIGFDGVISKVTDKGVTMNGSLTQDFAN